MRVNGTPTRSLWIDQADTVRIIDQTRLPHAYDVLALTSLDDAAHAIRVMQVRGAPLIGVTAAYGMALALRDNASDTGLESAAQTLIATRPTAVNLRWAVEQILQCVRPLSPAARFDTAWNKATELAEEDVATNCAIGKHGAALIHTRHQAKQQALNILTHCNAGWLATVDWGTALAPIYAAFDAGIPLHVWVDETRPRNQGASLTSWELKQHGIPHTIIADNTGGYLMQHGQVDMVIVGSDRTTANGDVCNKIGTYLKALAAFDNNVPFYAALPCSTIDWTLTDGVKNIPIEERGADEVDHISGKTAQGNIVSVQLVPDGVQVANYAFDVTPARLVTGIITERGVSPATTAGLAALFPEHLQ